MARHAEPRTRNLELDGLSRKSCCKDHVTHVRCRWKTKCTYLVIKQPRQDERNGRRPSRSNKRQHHLQIVHKVRDTKSKSDDDRSQKHMHPNAEIRHRVTVRIESWSVILFLVALVALVRRSCQGGFLFNRDRPLQHLADRRSAWEYLKRIGE